MPQHETLAAALAAFQAELPKLTKDQSAKVTGESQSGAKISYTYGYADLSQVTGEVSPVLGKHGLSFTSFPTMTEQGFQLVYSLMHERGERIDGRWPLPDPTRTKPQQLGSAITYARRYAFMAVTNTFPGGEDDDGAAAVHTGYREQEYTRERPQQQERPVSAPPAPAAPAKVWTDEEVMEQHAKIESLDLEKAGTLYDWMASRGLHDRPVAVDGAVDGDLHPVTATTRLAVRLAHITLSADTTVQNLSWIRDYADGRGLLKTMVTPNQMLADILIDRKRELTQATVDQSDNAQAMRAAAADSWAETDPADGEPTPGAAGQDAQ